MKFAALVETPPLPTRSPEVRFAEANELRYTGVLYVDSVFDWFTNRPALHTPGRYAIRIRFSPRYTPGADEFKIKFLGESALSSVVTITVLR